MQRPMDILYLSAKRFNPAGHRSSRHRCARCTIPSEVKSRLKRFEAGLSELQAARVTIWPSGPMHFWVCTHQQMLEPERGTVWSGSASMNIHLDRTCGTDLGLGDLTDRFRDHQAFPFAARRVARFTATRASWTLSVLGKRRGLVSAALPASRQNPHPPLFPSTLLPLPAKARAQAPRCPALRGRSARCCRRISTPPPPKPVANPDHHARAARKLTSSRRRDLAPGLP